MHMEESHSDEAPVPGPNVSLGDGCSAEGKPTEGPAADPDVPWLRATALDLENLDFEAPIAGSCAAAASELSDLFDRAVRPSGTGSKTPDSPEARIFVMLAAVTGMHLKPRERDEPFGPRFTLSDGSRTAIPADFEARHLDLLADMAMRSVHHALKARLADVCWLLDRRRAALGSVAIGAYVEVIEGVERGTLEFPHANGDRSLQWGACDLLRRALYIGWTVGWDRPEAHRARAAVVRLRERAIEHRAAAAAMWFTELDLEFSLTDPAAVAAGIEAILATAQPALDIHLAVSLWGIAARAYQAAKRNDEKHRCQIAAAEAMAAEAEQLLIGQDQRPGSAMHSSHMMSNAIAMLHGVPGIRERRTRMQYRLVDIQAGIADEMSAFSQQWDTKEVEAQVKAALDGGSLFDQLFVFAALGTSPDPRGVRAEAEQSMRDHPLLSLFPAVHYDSEGKAVHRSAAAGVSGDLSESAVGRQIAQTESIRRNMAGTSIELARRAITAQHFVPEQVLASILLQSPFVPPNLVATFSRGFLRFFQGDFASATYILTPLLENSLRHVLKMNGHDVTTFDDATQTQQDRTISSLFEQMRAELDAAFTVPITTDIDSVFLKRPGPHLRHDIAHGLGYDGTPYGADAVYGCWLIFRLCLLPLFPYREQLGAMIA